LSSLASVCDAVVLEYYRNEIEVRIKLPPRGSFRVCDIVGLRYSRDSSAPKNALDILVRTADTVPHSGGGGTTADRHHSPKNAAGAGHTGDSEINRVHSSDGVVSPRSAGGKY
jgi:hypothetical protein